jgi:hypothetical protein
MECIFRDCAMLYSTNRHASALYVNYHEARNISAAFAVVENIGLGATGRIQQETRVSLPNGEEL